MTTVSAQTAPRPRHLLRSATAAHHDRVDRLFSQADLGCREGYGRFLMAQAAAHLPIEAALTEAGAATLLPDWRERRRASALIQDLTALDLAMPNSCPAPAFDHPAAVLGGIYVLEGSRMGGRVLGRTVPSHLPSRFLDPGSSPTWTVVVAALEKRLVDRESLALAIAAASNVFAVYESSARYFMSVR
jgi:heme oxygenase